MAGREVVPAASEIDVSFSGENPAIANLIDAQTRLVEFYESLDTMSTREVAELYVAARRKRHDIVGRSDSTDAQKRGASDVKHHLGVSLAWRINQETNVDGHHFVSELGKLLDEHDRVDSDE